MHDWNLNSQALPPSPPTPFPSYRLAFSLWRDGWLLIQHDLSSRKLLYPLGGIIRTG